MIGQLKIGMALLVSINICFVHGQEDGSNLVLTEGSSFVFGLPDSWREHLNSLELYLHVTPATFTQDGCTKIAVAEKELQNWMVVTSTSQETSSIYMNTWMKEFTSKFVFFVFAVNETQLLTVVFQASHAQIAANDYPKSGMMTILPTTYLGKRYMLAVPSDYNHIYTFVIVNPHNVTTYVTISQKTSDSSLGVLINGVVSLPGSTDNIAVEAANSLEIKTTDQPQDISGTVVTSTESIAVVFSSSVNQNEKLPLYLEQFVPMYALGKEYVLSFRQPLENANISYKVVVTEEETVVNYQSEQMEMIAIVPNLGDCFVLYHDAGEEVVYMASDKPLLVIVQLQQSGSVFVDGAMTILSPYSDRVITQGPLTAIIQNMTTAATYMMLYFQELCEYKTEGEVKDLYFLNASSFADVQVIMWSSDTNNLYVDVTESSPCSGLSGVVYSGNDFILSAYTLSWGKACNETQTFDWTEKVCKDNEVTTEALTTDLPTTVGTTEVSTMEETTETTSNTEQTTETKETTQQTTEQTTDSKQTTETTSSKEQTTDTTTEETTNIATSEVTTETENTEQNAPPMSDTTETPEERHFQGLLNQCSCSCNIPKISSAKKFKQLKAEAKEEAKRIEKKLKEPKEKLSQTIRAKTSAQDERVEALGTGMLGIVLLMFTLIMLIAADMISVFQFITGRET